MFKMQKDDRAHESPTMKKDIEGKYGVRGHSLLERLLTMLNRTADVQLLFICRGE